MTEFYKFAADNNVLVFFLALCLVAAIQSVIGLLRTLYIRSCRLVMVTVRGWPPFHLDADGDWNPLVENINRGDAGFQEE